MEKHMQITIGIILAAVMLALAIGGAIWKRHIYADEYDRFAEKEDSYTLVVEGYDWGPAVPKIIVNVGDRETKWTPDKCTSANFTVSVTSESFDFNKKQIVEETRIRPIKSLYACDIDGNKTDDLENATHIAIEFEVKPDDSFFSPFYFNFKKQVNEWKKKYSYKIESTLLDGNILTENDMLCAAENKFKPMKVRKGSRLHAAYYAPDQREKGKKYPLIVWLHGAGEGGTDVSITLLGNKVTSLAAEEIQSYFGDAYVLCPQTPTVWMNANGTPYDILSPSCKNKSSQYTAECKQVIDDFIAAHSDIDTDRIYLGGCSNGGYMTINMLLAYPHFFAAAYPTCEAYNDSWLSDDQIALLAKTPLWFTAARTDTTVPPEQHAVPTVRRLREAGASDVHFSYFDNVVDTTGAYTDKDGTPYQYNGHWSWIYVFNDTCSDKDESSLWKWIAKQTLR